MNQTRVVSVAIALASHCVAALGCGGGSGSDPTTTTVEPTSSTGVQEGQEGTVDDSGTAPDGTGTAGVVPNLGVCADYIECVMEATPETLTAAIATYGEEGACWSLPGVTEQDCWVECTALLEILREAFPDCEAGGSALSHAVDIQPIWDAHCVTACHEAGGEWAILDLSDDAYDDIVDINAATFGLAEHVVPGEVEESYLWHKINGTQVDFGGNGLAMPKAPANGEATMLTQEELDTIEAWIAGGALP